MDEMVTQYLPQAFAFIYVINSANAGGVQKDRVSIKHKPLSGTASALRDVWARVTV